MTTKVWFEIWNITETPYKACHKEFDSEMDAEIYVHNLHAPRPDEPAINYEIRQVVQTTSAVNTITLKPRAVMSVEEIADNAINAAIGLVWFNIKDVDDYNLLSKEDQIRVNELFSLGADCCNTCGMHVSPEELDEQGDCDDCAYQREDDDFEED